MPIIEDKEFGRITVRRTSRGTGMRVSVAPNGTLRVSAPTYVPLFMVKRMVAGSRDELRRLRRSHPTLTLSNGMPVGKSHHLLVRHGSTLSLTRQGSQLFLSLPDDMSLADEPVIELARKHIIEALRREAKHYLPRRLEWLAEQHGHEYASVRFSHASGRWGSCSSKGVISLNIALMNLPYELIDYVLVHELAHTKRLDHSKSFWSEVEVMDGEYKMHRTLLKNHSPSV